ncbi:THUMP domain-containing protein [Candidatus Hodarchaeum mangrovi]
MSFLISSQRNQERDALSELYYVITDVLDYKTKPLKSRVPGLSLLTLQDEEIHPFQVVLKIREYIEENGPLIACLRITPLEHLFKTDILQITNHAYELVQKKVTRENTWAIVLRKRQTNLRSKEVISAVADKITWGTVKLTDPDYEIRIEIIRDLSGISVMKPKTEIKTSDYLRRI